MTVTPHFAAKDIRESTNPAQREARAGQLKAAAEEKARLKAAAEKKAKRKSYEVKLSKTGGTSGSHVLRHKPPATAAKTEAP